MEARLTPADSVGYESPAICAACGGKCCKAFPGAVFPEDHPVSLADWLIAAFKSGRYVLEPGFSEEYSHAWFVAPARVATSTGRVCIFLADKGCELPFDDRPTGCRMVQPKPHGACRADESDEVAAIEAWEPYLATLLYAAKLSGRA